MLKGGSAMSSNRDRLKLLEEIAALEFTVIELNLYLNTHPRDREALSEFNKAVTGVKALKEVYDKNFGMITSQDSFSSYPWEWLAEPWPWEYEANYKI
jgi:spore coat protein JB